MCGKTSLADSFPALVYMIQNFTAICSDDDQILYADTKATGQINTRLDGEYHSFLNDIGVGCANVSGIMIL